MADKDTGEEAAESEWRFPLSDFDGEDAEPRATNSVPADDAESAGDATDGGISAEPDRIEPGEPTLEGTVFVLLGVAFALFVISRPLVG